MSVFPGVSWDEQIAFATPKFGWRLRENLDVAVGGCSSHSRATAIPETPAGPECCSRR